MNQDEPTDTPPAPTKPTRRLAPRMVELTIQVLTDLRLEDLDREHLALRYVDEKADPVWLEPLVRVDVVRLKK